MYDFKLVPLSKRDLPLSLTFKLFPSWSCLQGDPLGGLSQRIPKHGIWGQGALFHHVSVAISLS